MIFCFSLVLDNYFTLISLNKFQKNGYLILISWAYLIEKSLCSTYFKKTTWKDIFDLLHITLSKVFLFHAAQHQKLCQIPGLVRAYA